MKKEILSTILAFIVAFGIFALNYAVNGGKHAAQASAFAGSAALSDLERPYTESRRIRIARTVSSSSQRLLHLYGRDIYEVLDRPELVRRDLPTIVWQYRSDSCVLDIYFTASGENVLAEPVVHYEVRARNKSFSQDNVERRCISSLIKPRESFSLLDTSAFYKSSL